MIGPGNFHRFAQLTDDIAHPILIPIPCIDDHGSKAFVRVLAIMRLPKQGMLMHAEASEPSISNLS